MMSQDKRDRYLPAAIALAAVIVHLRVLGNDFVNFDDVFYITRNPLIAALSPANLQSWFTGFYFGNYQPLTLLSLALDHRLAGPDPRVFHAVNLLLHALNTLLVFHLVRLLFARERGPWLAAATAALFAVHPLLVESVAWAAQRKDVLYALFYLGSLVAYVAFAQRPAGAGRRLYVASVLLFALSLLSKAMAVSLVGVILAVDLYLRRLPRLSGRGIDDPSRPTMPAYLREKLPYLILALAAGVTAVLAQRSAAFLGSPELHTPLQRAAIAGYGFAHYAAQLVLPLGLSAYHPYPAMGGGVPPGFLPHLAFVAAAAAGLVLALRRHPAAAFAILFYGVNILPVLQWLPVGDFIVAERFAYLASIGVFLLLALGLRELAVRRRRLRAPLIAAFIAYLVLLGVLTDRRCGVWRDSVTLWNDVLDRYPDTPLALNNRGLAWAERGDRAAALADLDRALQLDPRYADALGNRGVVKGERGDYDGAIADFDAALRLAPAFAAARAGRADALFRRGVARFQAADYAGAVADFERVAAGRPDYPGVRQNLNAARSRLQGRGEVD
jgi:tetratricopeptide (TPR) repeat protein